MSDADVCPRLARDLGHAVTSQQGHCGLARFDKLKDKGKLVKTKTGLDMYVPGFDPDAPEPQRQKFLGIF